MSVQKQCKTSSIGFSLVQTCITVNKRGKLLNEYPVRCSIDDDYLPIIIVYLDLPAQSGNGNCSLIMTILGYIKFNLEL